MKLVLRDVVHHSLHPVRHHVVPNVRCDHLVGYQAEQSIQSVFQVRCPRRQGFPIDNFSFNYLLSILKTFYSIESLVPVSAHANIVRRMRQKTGNEDVVVSLLHFRQPPTNVLGFQFLQRAFCLPCEIRNLSDSFLLKDFI